jgi:flagellar biogenesis protein FliO
MNISLIVKYTICILVLFLISTNSLCQETTKDIFSGNYGKPVVDYGKIIYTTVVVIIFILIVLIALKKFRVSNIKAQSLLEVVYSHSISTKDKLLIIKAGHEYLLLGLSNSGLRKIHVLDHDYVQNSISSGNINKQEFANIFTTILRNRGSA